MSGNQIDWSRPPYYYDAAKVKLDGIVYKFIVDPNVAGREPQVR